MPDLGSNWVCPYCGHAQVIHKERHDAQLNRIYVEEWENGVPGYYVQATVCSNANCRKLTLDFNLLIRGDSHHNDRGFKILGRVGDWRLLPASFAKPQPDYIPEPIRRDYREACAIRDLSPKAAATLVRRCIQGIIRDFCGITKKRLIDEIGDLRERVNAGNAPPGVQADTVQAIDHVRKIGNIGAHMEADIDVIVDVDPDEAQRLIELAELLFDEWYVARERRTQRLADLGVIAAQKAIEQQRRLPPPTEPSA